MGLSGEGVASLVADIKLARVTFACGGGNVSFGGQGEKFEQRPGW